MVLIFAFALALALVGWGWFVYGLIAGYLTLPIVGGLAAMIIGGFLARVVDPFFTVWNSNRKRKVIGTAISVPVLSAMMLGLWFAPTSTSTSLSIAFLVAIMTIEGLTIIIIVALLYLSFTLEMRGGSLR